MVEVFKTNVTSPTQAIVLVGVIHESFPDYRANFDLHDCDNILRVVCDTGSVHATGIVDLLQSYGYYAEPLPDEEPPGGRATLELFSTELTLLGPFRDKRFLHFSPSIAL
jgi:hypothetical protein